MSEYSEWGSKEPSPIEFFHAKLIEKFHDWRTTKTFSTEIMIDGLRFNDIVVRAKKETYNKYAHLDLKSPIERRESVESVANTANNCDKKGFVSPELAMEYAKFCVACRDAGVKLIHIEDYIREYNIGHREL